MENPSDRITHEMGPPTANSVLRTQPAFIVKLYKMLEDDTQDLICWAKNGEYFSVYNSALFSKQILPQYFKHNNWQSFVRQLNMYGFNKINEMIHSNLSFENQTWDFKHPHFKRGDFQAMTLVKRKSVRSAPGPALSSAPGPSSSPSSLLLQHNQQSTSGPGGMDGIVESQQQQQQPSHSDFGTVDDDAGGGVEQRVVQLDRQVLQVSQSVNRLVSEMQDIKSIIYQQENMIHGLASLLRSCNVRK
ncbi:HSF-type DNA-binding-domain-containing protein [Absidia repens]|uniref:HSF-type DNA-binding-domain-containing protein n=1 Tax=Absidia repens TaxID=90262 RepID=A0A1X2IM58_9FUNG|nr:HSF-type DNA-binding-domain-containing protein [Absidia repens]